MNGAHDMGGNMGFGPVEPEPAEPSPGRGSAEAVRCHAVPRCADRTDRGSIREPAAVCPWSLRVPAADSPRSHV